MGTKRALRCTDWTLQCYGSAEKNDFFIECKHFEESPPSFLDRHASLFALAPVEGKNLTLCSVQNFKSATVNTLFASVTAAAAWHTWLVGLRRKVLPVQQRPTWKAAS